jgi:Tfp pilus assembly protein PilO
MNSTNRLIVAILVVAALAIGFWVLLLGPKREKVDELSSQVETLNATLVQAQSQVAVAEEAKRAFPDDYRQLVTLGGAVPEGDETSSLLVELGTIAERSKVDFNGIQLTSSGGEVAPEAPVTAPPAEVTGTEATGAVPAAATVPPTEAAASLLPLGASVGTAGLAVMPYTLSFRGSFFEIADFIAGIDSLVDPEDLKVGVKGRLVTIDGFSLAPPREGNDDTLDVSFVVTAYVTPPGEGITAGATPTAPPPSSPAPASATTEPESDAETVAAQ